MTLVQHLKDRHVDLGLHRFLLDEENHVATALLYNLSGQLCGYQQYNFLADKTRRNDPKEGRYYTYKTEGTLVVFGVESLHLTPHLVFLVEGMFDAARLCSRGFSALAVLSNNPTQDLKDFLKCLNRKVVALCDNDAPGLKLAEFGHEAVVLTSHDVGDSTEEELDNLLSNYV
jgi:hypothetical protein